MILNWNRPNIQWPYSRTFDHRTNITSKTKDIIFNADKSYILSQEYETFGSFVNIFQ